MTPRPISTQPHSSLARILALALFGLCAAALLCAGGLLLLSSIRTHQVALSSQQQLVARDAARTVSGFIKEHLDTLKTAVWVADLHLAPPADQQRILASVLSQQPALRWLMLLDAQGQVTARRSWMGLPPPDDVVLRFPVADRASARERQLYVGEVFFDPVTSEPLILLAVPVRDVFGDWQGFLVGEVNLKFMWDVVRRLKVGTAGRAFVVNHKGTLIACEDISRMLKGENLLHLPSVREGLSSTNRAPRSIIAQGLTGERTLSIAVRLDIPDWVVVSELPLTDAYRTVIREAYAFGVILLLISGLAGFAGTQIAHRLAVPLVNLTNVATQIARGERQLLATVSGPEEVVRLAEAFNSMTGQLHQSVEDLERQIAEVKRAETALRESEEKFRALVETTNDFIWEVDIEGRFTYASPQIHPLLGYAPEEILHRNLLDFMPPDEAAKVGSVFGSLIASKKAFYNLENVSCHKDGRRLVLETSGTPIFDATGRLWGYRGIDRDITERKRAETERDHLIAELEAKNAELERFTYTVSHDLKSPLITIKGFAGALQNDLASGRYDRFPHDLQRISAASDKMTALLDDLLELSRIGRLINPPTRFPLAGLVREALELLAGPISQQPVEIVVQPGLPEVCGDRRRLLEVYQNLVENALRFFGHCAQPKIEIGMRQQEGEQVFFVRDNGIGIDPRYHKTVFGLFNKLDAKSSGTGIGLTLVQRIIEVHGGRIWIESEGRDHGATFCFTLAPTPP